MTQGPVVQNRWCRAGARPRWQDPADLTFTFATRAWRALDIDFRRGVVRVEPIPEGSHARWSGRPTLLGRELCQAIRDVLTTENHAIGFKEDAGQSEVAIRQALEQLQTERRPNAADGLAYAEGLEDVRLSKFQACLLRRLEAEYLATLWRRLVQNAKWRLPPRPELRRFGARSAGVGGGK